MHSPRKSVFWFTLAVDNTGGQGASWPTVNRVPRLSGQHAREQRLRFALYFAQVTLAREALRIQLVNVFRTRGASSKPSARGRHLEAAESRTISGRGGLHRDDRVAREFGGAHLLGRELRKHI